MEPPLTTATNLDPSAEEATAFQLAMGALVAVQVWASPGLTTISGVPKRPNTSSASFMLMDGSDERWKRASSASAQFGEGFRLFIILMFQLHPIHAPSSARN